MISKILFSVAFAFYALQVLGGPNITKEHIHIDQFGYLCNAQKIAIISSPQSGYNSSDAFNPGTGVNNYSVRKWSDNSVLFTGTLVAWNGGATHTESGDKVWWFDFSPVTTAGEYYVFDQANNAGSFKFTISDDVYDNVLKHAIRSFYYQRCGVSKQMPYASAGWTDVACHVGSLQDKKCRLYDQKTNAATEKDLSGGWHDAGDYTKYTNFTSGTLKDLLLAYEENPSVWSDDYQIPESGNGVPDILDEVKFELDWLLKMQQSDGSVLCIVGHGNGSPPSMDNQQSVYGPATTSATLNSAAAFSLAAMQFKSLGIPSMTTYGNTLQTAAINAWNWASFNPNIQWQNNTSVNGSQGVGAGLQETDDYGRLTAKMGAGVFLYALTSNNIYKTFVETNYNQLHMVAWYYVYPFEHYQQDILLYYSKLSGISASIGNDIKTTYTNSFKTNDVGYAQFTRQTDAYRAYLKDYGWGSNSTKSSSGQMFWNMIKYGLDPANNTNFRNGLSAYVHYMHGVNPNAFAYLTNMGSYGAEKSVNEIYHSWFSDNSPQWDRVGTSTYGPAPGILSGGPNPNWSLDGCCATNRCGGSNSMCSNLTPPSGQPKQKAYRDWNTGWPQNSWEVTENGIYYQAAYVRMLGSLISFAESCFNSPIVTNSIQGDLKPKITLFPNPADKGTFMVSGLKSENNKIVIYSVLGEIIFKSTVSANEEIDVSKLSLGIYTVMLELNTMEKIFLKLIKE